MTSMLLLLLLACSPPPPPPRPMAAPHRPRPRKSLQILLNLPNLPRERRAVGAEPGTLGAMLGADGARRRVTWRMVESTMPCEHGGPKSSKIAALRGVSSLLSLLSVAVGPKRISPPGPTPQDMMRSSRARVT